MTVTSHQLIFEHFQQLRALHPSLNGDQDDPIPTDFNKFCEKLFLNWKPHNPSYRLNGLGFELFSKLYHYYQYQLPENHHQLFNTGHVIVGLQRHMKTPYYIGNHHFIVFDQEIALEIEVVGQDIPHWINSFLKP